jgi:hypothetical protein
LTATVESIEPLSGNLSKVTMEINNFYYRQKLWTPGEQNRTFRLPTPEASLLAPGHRYRLLIFRYPLHDSLISYQDITTRTLQETAQ